MRATMIGVLLVGAFLGARMSEAGELTAWRLPFSNSSPFQVAASGQRVVYVDFDGGVGVTFLGMLDPAKGKFREMATPFSAGTPADLHVRAGDGAVFFMDAATGDLGQGNVEQGVFRRWTLPNAGVRSFAFDDAGAVLFLAGSPEGRMLVGRLDTVTGAVAIWPLPDSLDVPGDDFAWKIVRAADGTVFINMNGFGHPAQLVRLDLATGVFTAWVTPAAPVFALVADGAGDVYFHETGGGVRRAARLVAATGRLTEWNLPSSDVEFVGEMALESGRLFFGLDNPASLVALDPSAAGDESILAPFVADPVTPSTAVISPVVTQRARSRTGHANPIHRTVPATVSGAFTQWDAGPASLGNGDGAGAIYFATDVGGPSLGRFVP